MDNLLHHTLGERIRYLRLEKKKPMPGITACRSWQSGSVT